MQLILPINPTDLWPVGVNRAALARHVMMPARTVPPVEKARFLGEVYISAAQPALVTGERLHRLNQRR